MARGAVRLDLLRAVLDESFLDSVFQDMPLPSRVMVRGLFERVCAASPMRLSATSVEKLFDLMVMAFKCAPCRVLPWRGAARAG